MRTTLSVIIPVYNEAPTIQSILTRLTKQTACKELIIVDDGSTDGSLRLIKQFLTRRGKQKKPIIKLFTKQNGGKGSAIRLGLEHVTGTHVLIQDADCEYDPEDIPALLKPIQRAKAEVVYGSRFAGPHTNLLFWHRVGNHLLNFLVNILYNTTLSDMETCYKLIPTSLLRQLQVQSDCFAIEPEITCKLLKRGVKIYEVPISYSGRDFSQGKKITWKDGITALKTIFLLRFS